jgi:plastocyanin
MNDSSTARETTMNGTHTRIASFAALALAIAIASTVLVGCGEPTDGDPTPVKTFKITPAATGAGETTAPATTATPVPIETPSAAGATLKVAGVSSTFDITELEAPAGPITIIFDNREAGVIHNLSLYPGDDASKDPIAATELEPGPIVQELKLTLEAGDYFYQCDAHPTTMKGTLEIS